MSKTRLVLTAVIIEGRSQAAVAREYGVSKGWVSKLVTRYRAEGDTAFAPRSRRPRTRPDATPAATIDLIVELRRQLTAQGFDAGADTISWHLEHHHRITLSRATIYRILRRNNLVKAAPNKKPKASYIRFQADQPNETWQADVTHHRLADGTDAEILTWLDDHSRYALSVTAHQPVTGPIVVTTFRNTITNHGIPASTLTDNGLIFTTRFANGGRTSRNGLEKELARLRVRQKNSRPNHPTTCGKVERFQQTMKKWLRAQPPATTLNELQHQLDTFTDLYNHHRPHRSLPHHTTPAVAYTTRPKATPDNNRSPTTSSASATTASTPATSACASTATCTTSASAEPSTEPASSHSSTATTSASSTPPPAKSSAHSPSTPTSATTAPDNHQADPPDP